MVWFMIFALCPLGVIGFMGYYSGRQNIVNNVKSHLESVAILKEQEINNWIEHLSHTLTWLAISPRLRNETTVLTTHAVADAKYRAAYKSLVAEFMRIAVLEHLSLIFLMDSTGGEVIAASDAAWERKIRDAEQYFIQGKREIFVSDIFFSLTLGRPTMIISAPVKDSSGRLVGVMAGHANLQHLSAIMLERSGLGETAETFLVNRSNLLITNTIFAPKGAFKKWIFGQGATRALEGKNGVGQFVDYRGEPVIGAYRWLEHGKMALIAKQDESEAFAPATALRNTIIEIAIGVFLFVTVIGILISRSITIPLEKLTKGTEIIGKRDLSYRVDVKTKDEIGILASAFNKMVSDLENVSASRDDLNKEIKERKLAEEQTKQLEGRLRLQIERMPFGLIIWDKAFRTKSWNPAAEKIFGYTAEEAVGKHPFKLIVPEETQAHANNIWSQILESDITTYSVNENITKDGRTIICDWSNTTIKEADGTVVGVLSMVQDITERKQAEEELEKHRKHLEEMVKVRTANLDKRISEVEQLNSAMVNLLGDLRVSNESLEIKTQQLDTANKELDAFAYSVSHDLRAPLRAIDGFSQMLTEDHQDKLNKEGKRQLNVIQGSARQMGQLIDDLLAFSRLGRKELRMSDINMRALAEEVVKQLQIIETEKTAQLKIDSLPTALGDQSMIREVFANLLSNALKYTAPREAAVIEVSAKTDGNESIYSVRDNGVGFNMKYADKLFQVFQRLHSAEEFEGTGIGLALVQRIIHRHGGRVWAEGKVNKGATFYFSLPKGE